MTLDPGDRRGVVSLGVVALAPGRVASTRSVRERARRRVLGAAGLLLEGAGRASRGSAGALGDVDFAARRATFGIGRPRRRAGRTTSRVRRAARCVGLACAPGRRRFRRRRSRPAAWTASEAAGHERTSRRPLGSRGMLQSEESRPSGRRGPTRRRARPTVRCAETRTPRSHRYGLPGSAVRASVRHSLPRANLLVARDRHARCGCRSSRGSRSRKRCGACGRSREVGRSASMYCDASERGRKLKAGWKRSGGALSRIQPRSCGLEGPVASSRRPGFRSAST